MMSPLRKAWKNPEHTIDGPAVPGARALQHGQMFDHRQRRKQPPALGHDRDLAIGDVGRSQAYQALIAPRDRSRTHLRQRPTLEGSDEDAPTTTDPTELSDIYADP